jgi:hypothetical protein
MIGEFTKVRGWAIGLQGLIETPGGPQPKVVSVLDLGPGNGLRPMLGMGVMMAGVPAGRIEGMDVIRVNEPAGGGIACDDRLVVYARPYEQLEWCIKQRKSTGDSPSLATANPAFGRLARESRSGSALAVWADPGQLLAAIRQGAGPGGANLEQIAAGLQAAGVTDVTCRAVFDPQDPFVEATANLDAGQPSQVMEMLGTGPLGTDVFRCVPSEAIVLAAGGVSEAQKLALTEHLPMAENPLMNVAHMAMFAVPPDAQAAALGDVDRALVGSLGFVATVPEGAHAEDLLDSLRTFVDVLAMQTGASFYSNDTEDGLVEFALPEGGPASGVYLGAGEGFVVASMNRELVRHAMDAARSGDCALAAGPLQDSLSRLEPEVSAVLVASAADVVAAATALTETTRPADEKLTGLLGDLREVLQGARLQLTTAEFPASVTMRAGAVDLPSLAEALPVLTALSQYRPPVIPVEPVDVHRSAAPAKVDGRTDDWAGVAPLPWKATVGDAGEARVVWREDGLYGLVISNDLDVQPNDDQPWMNDSLQVFIEVDNARRRGFSEQSRGILFWPTPFGGPGDVNIQAEDHGGETSRALGWDATSGIECSWDMTDTGYALEFYVPSSMLGGQDLAAGAEMGLCLFLRNGDVAPAASFCAEEGGNTWQRPDLWGAIRLSAD